MSCGGWQPLGKEEIPPDRTKGVLHAALPYFLLGGGGGGGFKDGYWVQIHQRAIKLYGKGEGWVA